MDSQAMFLDPQESLVLEEERILLSAPTNGKRKVSAALLTPPSTEGSQRSGSTASVRIRPFNPSIIQPFDLPESDKSVAAVEFLGFTRKVAGDIFARWAARPDPEHNPYDLLEYALGHVDRLNSQPLNDVPAIQAMIALGISNELQHYLTDPKFSRVFESQTLHYWLTDTIKARHATLTTLLERVKSCAVQTIAKRKQQKRPKIAGVFEPGSSSSTQQQSTAAATVRASELASGIPLRESLPSIYVDTETAPQVIPGHYVLYKGGCLKDLNEKPLVFEDGKVNMNALRTYEGGDFNQINYAWYWTEEMETAEKYREWAAARDELGNTCIIRIQIPMLFIDGLRKEELWYSADWKEYVWYCRKGDSSGSLPKKFDKYQEAQLVRGHICGRSPATIPRIKKEEVQQRMSEGNPLMIGNQKATQSVFFDPKAVDQLASLVQGKFHLDIHPPLAPPQKA